jgi:glycosyltransferase involved in cell wall biosynthesis
MTSQKSLEPARFGGVARPHVVHVVGTLGAGGVQRLVLGLATSKALSRYRHSVLCMLGATGNLRSHFESLPMRIESCSVKWPSIFPIGSYSVSEWLRQRLSFTFPGRLAALLGRMEADLVHTHLSVHVSRQANGVVRRAGLPWVWTLHNDYRPDSVELEDWRKAFRIASRGSAVVTAVAQEIAASLRNQGLPGIETSRGGVDLSRFRSAGGRDHAWRESRGIPTDAVVMGAAGRLVAQKAYDVVLEAAARVTGGPPVHIAIAGAGPERSALEAQTRRLGLERRVHWIGFQDDVPSFLHQLDVFLIPSRFEGFPIALVEALASGLPCIATPVGGVPEILGNDDGILVPVESVEPLADAMRRMQSPDLRQQFADRARPIAERFSLDRLAEQLAGIYGRLFGAAAGDMRSERKVV